MKALATSKRSSGFCACRIASKVIAESPERRPADVTLETGDSRAGVVLDLKDYLARDAFRFLQIGVVVDPHGDAEPNPGVRGVQIREHRIGELRVGMIT